MTVSEQEVVELEEGQEFVSLDEKTPDVGQVLEQEVIQEPEFAMPDKFKDKGIEDVVTSYQQLESERGRQANELGELRKLTDELLQLQLQDKKKEEVLAPELDVDTLLENPNAAINSAVDNNPRLKALEDQLAQGVRNQEQVKFEEKHPDSQALLNDSAFVDYIQASPVRLKMFQEAHANFDYNVADELFSNFKEIHGTKKEEAQQKATAKRTKGLKAAKTERGSTGNVPVKIFRRSDLINLRMNDRDRFDAMSDEITAAYAEGRVK